MENGKEMRELKATFRKERLCARRALDENERQKFSGRIAETVLSLPAVREAKRILCYASYREEVRTVELIENLLEQGKRVYLPKVEPAALLPEMEFYEVHPGMKLVDGIRHIPEPAGDTEEFPVGCEETMAVLLPGAVFDRKGGRIGYGGGYYDRYLARLEAASGAFTAAGLCFSCQLTKKAPQEPFDRRMDLVVTEAEVIFPDRE